MEKRSLETLTIAGGWLCLDFVNTVSDRSIDSPFEYLSSYPHVLEWTNGRKLVSATQNSQLNVLSKKRPIESAKSWIRTLEVREMLFRYFQRIAKGRSPELKDQNSFNKWLSKSLNKSAVEFDKNKAVLSWNIRKNWIGKYEKFIMELRKLLNCSYRKAINLFAAAVIKINTMLYRRWPVIKINTMLYRRWHPICRIILGKSFCSEGFLVPGNCHQKANSMVALRVEHVK